MQFVPQSGTMGFAPGMPEGARPRGLIAWRDRVVFLLRDGERWALWSHDGLTAKKLAGDLGPWQRPVLGAGAGALWVAEGGEGGGTEEGNEARLWRSAAGNDWQVFARLPGGRPSGIATLAGAVFVTGAGADGRGLLWTQAPQEPTAALTGMPDLPRRSPQPLPFADWSEAGARLDALLDGPESYARHGRALRDLVFRLAQAEPPAGFFAARLSRPLPDQTLSLIGGAVEQPAADLGRWILLWGMALAGNGPVPSALLSAPWSLPDNPSQKYFGAAPAALAAVALTGQRDRASLQTIVERLGRAEEPAWLRGDALGALNALTGERLGVDVAAWQAWWREVGETWQP